MKKSYLAESVCLLAGAATAILGVANLASLAYVEFLILNGLDFSGAMLFHGQLQGVTGIGLLILAATVVRGSKGLGISNTDLMVLWPLLCLSAAFALWSATEAFAGAFVWWVPIAHLALAVIAFKLPESQLWRDFLRLFRRREEEKIFN